jgi:hypothetical protein
MLFKKAKHRNFEYLPRYYDPEKDPELKRRERFRFRSNVRRGRQPGMVLIFLLLLLVVIAYFMISGS